jgi:hypothetical protein
LNEVVLSQREAEDAARYLRGFIALLRAELPDEAFSVLDETIGPEVLRYGNPQGLHLLAVEVKRLLDRFDPSPGATM